MFCENCGVKYDDDSKFCENCGALIEREVILSDKSKKHSGVNFKNFFNIKKLSQKKDGLFTSSSQTQSSLNSQPEFNSSEEISLTEELSEIPADSVIAEKKKKRNKIISIIIPAFFSLIFILTALTALFFILNAYFNNPENTIKNYINTRISGDWNEVFDYLDIKPSAFLSKDVFLKTVQQPKLNADIDFSQVENYDIEKLTTLQSNDITDNSLRYIVTLKDKNNQFIKSLKVFLKKSDEKNLWFFNKYKISPSEFVVTINNITEISVPLGMNLFVDNIQLFPVSIPVDKKTSTQTHILYEIKDVFIGEHAIKVTAPFIKDYEQKISLTNLISKKYVLSNEFQITDEFSKEISDKAKELVDFVFLSAINNKSFHDVLRDLELNLSPQIKNQISFDIALYETIRKNSKKMGLKSFTTTDFKVIENTILFDDFVNFDYDLVSSYEVGIRFKYKCNYSKPDDFQSSRVRIYFNFVDDKLKISHFKMRNFIIT